MVEILQNNDEHNFKMKFARAFMLRYYDDNQLIQKKRSELSFNLVNNSVSSFDLNKLDSHINEIESDVETVNTKLSPEDDTGVEVEAGNEAKIEHKSNPFSKAAAEQNLTDDSSIYYYHFSRTHRGMVPYTVYDYYGNIRLKERSRHKHNYVSDPHSIISSLNKRRKQRPRKQQRQKYKQKMNQFATNVIKN